MEKQTFFFSNTHFSKTHDLHGNKPVASEWFLGVRDEGRASGFRSFGPSLGHTNFSGQTTLDMFTGGKMNLTKIMP